MEFIHQPYQEGETIAAIATPPGEGGVAIIRISGEDALEVADSIFSGDVHSYKSHTVHFGAVLDDQDEKIDDVLLIPMLGRKSYTGEDTVEIHCHGGALITRKVLETILKAGCRAARPGEFTFKAFMNGRIDLTQAEAVQELISAKNEYALEAAQNHLDGSLSQKIYRFKEELTNIAAILEAWVDFPEEGLEFATLDEICSDLERISKSMQKLISSFHDGKILHDGLSLCLIGSPNVGKSSIMNALLDKNRAIVSHIPGTTRDLLEDQMRINGLNLKLIDTAGIRVSDEIIEQEGIKRSQEAMHSADLILFILDASKGIDDEDKHVMGLLPNKKTIVIWNKIDLPHHVPEMPFTHTLHISAKERTGIDQLREKIDEVIWENGPPSKEEVVITNVRHKEALKNAIDACEQVIFGLKKEVSPEFISSDMRVCLNELGIIIGTNITEDILTAIFSKFCIGK